MGMKAWRVLAAGCSLATSAPAWAGPNVVVTSKPIHSLVAGVMAGIGEPRLLVDGNASPHTYALKPSDAKSLSEARVVFRVSEQLEPFTARIAASLPATTRMVSLAEAPGLDLLEMREGGAFESHQHKHVHAKDKHADDDTDPHVWLDPANARKLVTHIARVLAEASPADAEALMANASSLDGRLVSLAGELEQRLRPVAAKPFVVFHDSLHYLEARFGLTAAGSITVRPEQQPSAKRLVELRRKIGALSAVCVFAEPQYPDKLIASVTEGTSAKTAVIDPEGGLLPAGPDLYFALMRNAADAMRSCLD